MVDQNDLRNKTLNKIIALSEKYNAMILNEATGIGKSYQAIRIALNHSKKWVIVCWELNHIDNWKREFIKHNVNSSNFEFTTYISFRKYSGDYNVIFDECHHININHLNVVKGLNTDYLLFLSATLDKDDLDIIYEICKLKSFKVHKISLSLIQAVNIGLLPKPKINIVYVDLDNTIKSEEVIVTNSSKSERVIQGDIKDYSKLSKINKGKFILTGTQLDKYNYYDKLYTSYKNAYYGNGVEYLKNLFLLNASFRKTYMAYCKTDALNSLLKPLNLKRKIVFVGNIKQCTEIGGIEAIHSKMTSKKVKAIIDIFNSNVGIKSLYCVGMLKEGQNLENIECGVITQLANSENAFLQILGRVLRSEDPEIYCLILRNTVDENYFNKCTENIPKDWINVIKI